MNSVAHAANPTTFRPRLATTALFLANGIGIGCWAGSIAPIKLALGLDDAALGLALLAFAVGSIATMVVTGHLGARFGSARVTTIAALFFALALPLPALMSGWTSLAGAIFVLGAGNGTLDVSMNGHGTLVERARGRPIMSSLHAAFSLGCLIGAAGAGWILELGYGPRATLGMASALGLVLTLLAAPNLAVPKVAGVAPDEPVGFALPNRAVLQVGALAFLCMFAEGAIADWAAVYLVSVAGTTAAAAAAGFSGFAFAMTLGRLLGDRLVHRLGVTRIVTLGGAIAAVGLALTLAVPRLEVAVIGYALAGIGIANIVPVLFSAAGRRVRGHPAIGVGMAATCGYAGFLLSPPLIGLISHGIGLRSALVLLVVALLATAAAARPALR